MKKRKILACILAATSTLAIAMTATGCGVKDWFDEKIHGKDEATACVHADVDYNNACDHCNVATTFKAVDVVVGEKATGNWYRFYNYSCEYPAYVSTKFSDGEESFTIDVEEYKFLNVGIQSVTPNAPTIVTGGLTFYKNEIDGGFCYYDVYMMPGHSFTINVRCELDEAGDDYVFESYTFTLDDSITVTNVLYPERVRRLNVVAVES